MKKFTKGCLMTALILFFVGLAISLVGGLLGGFKQLREMETAGGVPLIKIGNLKLGRLNIDTNGGKNWEQDGYFLLNEGRDNGISITAHSFTELDIELATCFLYLDESEDDQIRVWVEGDTLRYYWTADGSTFRVENEGKLVNNSDDKVHISIPKEQMWREVDVEFGAGFLHALLPLQAQEITISTGAGVCELQEVLADEVELTVGAGSIDIDVLNARAVEIEVGAGELVVRDIAIEDEADISMNMGDAKIHGSILGDLSLNCNMGNVEMQLTGSEEDHSYTVDCGMGSVTIGGNDCGGLGASRTWYAGKESEFDVECNMGSVTILFEELPELPDISYGNQNQHKNSLSCGHGGNANGQ